MLEKAKVGEARAKEAKCRRYKGSERPQETPSLTLGEVFVIICVQTQSKPLSLGGGDAPSQPVHFMGQPVSTLIQQYNSNPALS